MNSRNKSPKKSEIELNPDQVLSDFLRRYTTCIQQVSKFRVELAELQMDAELMNSSGALFEMKLNQISSNLPKNTTSNAEANDIVETAAEPNTVSDDSAPGVGNLGKGDTMEMGNTG